MTLFRNRSEIVLKRMHITAMAIPFPTLPCSNCLLMYVDTVSVFVGAIREGVTSSRNAMINVIIHPEITPRNIRGRVMCNSI